MIVIDRVGDVDINLLKNDIGNNGNIYFASFQSSTNDVIPDFYYLKGGNYKKEVFTLKEGFNFFSAKKTICVGDSDIEPAKGTSNFINTDKYIAFLYDYEDVNHQYLYFLDKNGEIWKMKIDHFRNINYWLKLDDPNAI